MTPIRLRGTRVLGGLLLTLTACGGDGGDDTPSPGALGTLAYVETECHDTKEGFVERQALRIRQGDRAPVTVFETPGVGPLAVVAGLCRSLTLARFGEFTITRQAFQAVAVSPDGTSVVFEVTDEFSVYPAPAARSAAGAEGHLLGARRRHGLAPAGAAQSVSGSSLSPHPVASSFLGLRLRFSPRRPNDRLCRHAARRRRSRGRPDRDHRCRYRHAHADHPPATRRSTPRLSSPMPQRSASLRFVDERTISFYSTPTRTA